MPVPIPVIAPGTSGLAPFLSTTPNASLVLRPPAPRTVPPTPIPAALTLDQNACDAFMTDIVSQLAVEFAAAQTAVNAVTAAQLTTANAALPAGSAAVTSADLVAIASQNVTIPRVVGGGNVVAPAAGSILHAYNAALNAHNTAPTALTLATLQAAEAPAEMRAYRNAVALVASRPKSAADLVLFSFMNRGLAGANGAAALGRLHTAPVGPGAAVNGVTPATVPLTFGDAFTQLFGRTSYPGTIKAFVESLNEANLNAIGAGIADTNGPAGSSLQGKGVNAIYQALKDLTPLKNFLEALRPTPALTTYVAPAPIVNSANLSLLYSNPLVSKIVMAQRQKQTLAAAARPVYASGAGPFGMPGMPGMGAMPGLHIRIGGASNAFASIDPSNYAPIEMRGAGPMFASMRGGNYVIGTASSPTQWRPVDSNSFISSSLEGAIAQLTANISAQGATIDPQVNTNVQQLIQDLKNAEKAVIDESNKLTAMNNSIASGMTRPTGQVSAADIQLAADAYNNAMKNRQKIENKLFRVVIALGGKQLYP